MVITNAGGSIVSVLLPVSFYTTFKINFWWYYLCVTKRQFFISQTKSIFMSVYALPMDVILPTNVRFGVKRGNKYFNMVQDLI